MNIIKTLLLCLLFTALFKESYSQDLLITKEGDSVECKILNAKEDYIYFVMNYENQTRNTLMPIQQVQVIMYDYFLQPIGSKMITSEYANFRAGVNIGYSKSLAGTRGLPPQLQEFASGLTTGLNWGVDLAYFFSETSGFGIKYHNFKTSNSTDKLYLRFPDGSTYSGHYSNDVSINYIGPTYNTRILSANNKDGFHSSFGFGYLRYVNDEVLYMRKFPNIGSTIGYSIEVGYDMIFLEELAIGFKLEALIGSLREVEIRNGSQTMQVEHEVGLSRIDLSIGLRIIK